MKIKILLSTLVLAGMLPAGGDDIREKVAKAVPDDTSDDLIHPNKTILGLEVGESEDEVIKKLGPPQGYLRLDKNTTALIYSASYAYIFTEGRLSGILISHSVIDHQLLNKFSPTRMYSPNQWVLDNGIKADMTLEDVREILGERLKTSSDHPSKYEQYYEDGDTQVFLFFSHYSDKGESDSAYNLFGIMLKPKS